MSDTAPAKPVCDQTPKQFTAAIELFSTQHHVKDPQHILSPLFVGQDGPETCDDDDCAGFFRHGRSSMIKWQTWCVPVDNKCAARVKVDPGSYTVYANNIAGAGYHDHNGIWQYSCAFTGTSGAMEMTNKCSVNGSESVKPVAKMDGFNDGVIYGSGYAANHDNSNAPSYGISVGYGGAGAFIIINNSANGTYTQAQAFSQLMTCDSAGKPVKASKDGDGRPYPIASDISGNEQKQAQ